MNPVPRRSSQQWRYGGSVSDAYRVGRPRTPGPLRGVVSLRTAESYGFRRPLDRLGPLLAGAEVAWQTVATDVSGPGIEGHDKLPDDQLSQAITEVDAVVSHAGTGAALTAEHAGHRPVLVPRRVAPQEHLDDHQHLIAAEPSRRELAGAREVDDLDLAARAEAASRSVVRSVTPPPYRLLGH